MANGKDTLYHAWPYQKFCIITGSETLERFWKVRKCAARDDKSMIAITGTRVAGGWVLEVPCVVQASVMCFLISRTGTFWLFFFGNSESPKLGGGHLFKRGWFLRIFQYICGES